MSLGQTGTILLGYNHGKCGGRKQVKWRPVTHEQIEHVTTNAKCNNVAEGTLDRPMNRLPL